MYIFSDYAGTITNKKERSVVFTAVLCSNNKKREIDDHCSNIMDNIYDYCNDTNTRPIEFHSSEIFSPRKDSYWRSLPPEIRLQTAERIKNVIRAHNLPYAIVYIDKDKGGVSDIEKYNNFLKERINSELSKVPKAEMNQAAITLVKLFGSKGFGPLAHCYYMLFALSSGILDYYGHYVEAQLVTDEQFMKNIKNWNGFFTLCKTAWPFIKANYNFPNWPKGKKPDWRINEKVMERNSCEEFGIQLADYLAYTLMRAKYRGFDAKRFCVIEPRDLVQFDEYNGIFLGLQSNSLRANTVKYKPCDIKKKRKSRSSRRLR